MDSRGDIMRGGCFFVGVILTIVALRLEAHCQYRQTVASGIAYRDLLITWQLLREFYMLYQLLSFATR